MQISTKSLQFSIHSRLDIFQLISGGAGGKESRYAAQNTALLEQFSPTIFTYMYPMGQKSQQV